MSDVMLANVEALAELVPPCYKGPYNSALPEAVKCAQPCKKEKKGVVEQLINAIDY